MLFSLPILWFATCAESQLWVLQRVDWLILHLLVPMGAMLGTSSYLCRGPDMKGTGEGSEEKGVERNGEQKKMRSNQRRTTKGPKKKENRKKKKKTVKGSVLWNRYPAVLKMIILNTLSSTVLKVRCLNVMFCYYSWTCIVACWFPSGLVWWHSGGCLQWEVQPGLGSAEEDGCLKLLPLGSWDA